MRRIPRFAWIPALVVLLGSSSALAQRRGHHLHDGFYFRGSIGVGTFAVDQESDFGGVPDGRVTGPGGASDLMVGGTPVRGLAVGGALLANQAPDPRFESDRLTVEPNVDATWVIIGPFVDFFVIPTKGFHLGAAAGPSAIWYRDLDPDQDDRREAYAGVGVGGFIGYDAFISSNWSLGGYLRATAAWTTREVDYSGSPLVDERANATSLAVLFTALYH